MAENFKNHQYKDGLNLTLMVHEVMVASEEAEEKRPGPDKDFLEMMEYLNAELGLPG